MKISSKSLNQQFVHLFFQFVKLLVHMVDLLAHSGHLHHRSLDFYLCELLVHDDIDEPLAHLGDLRHQSLDFCFRQSWSMMIWTIRWPIRAIFVTTPSTFAFVNSWFMMIWTIRWPIRAISVTTPLTFAFLNSWFMMMVTPTNVIPMLTIYLSSL